MFHNPVWNVYHNYPARAGTPSDAGGLLGYTASLHDRDLRRGRSGVAPCLLDLRPEIGRNLVEGVVDLDLPCLWVLDLDSLGAGDALAANDDRGTEPQASEEPPQPSLTGNGGPTGRAPTQPLGTWAPHFEHVMVGLDIRLRRFYTYDGPSITGCLARKSSSTSTPIPAFSSGRTQPSRSSVYGVLVSRSRKRFPFDTSASK